MNPVEEGRLFKLTVYLRLNHTAKGRNMRELMEPVGYRYRHELNLYIVHNPKKIADEGLSAERNRERDAGKCFAIYKVRCFLVSGEHADSWLFLFVGSLFPSKIRIHKPS